MKAFRSLRWRLQFWYGALFALTLGGLGFAAYQVERRAAQARIDEELQRKVIELLGAMRPAQGPPGRNQPPPPRLRPPPGPEGARAPSESDLFEEGDRVRSMYFVLWHRDAPRLASSLAPEGVFRPEGEGAFGVRQRGIWREVFVHPTPGDCVLVGRSVAHELAEWRRLAWLITASSGGVFAFALVSGWWLAGRVLRPIQDIGATAAKISTGDLAQRIDTRDADSELGELAAVLNATFARLETAFAQQARFTADAAHELRTPVSVILMHAQSALGAPGLSEEQREAFAACERAAQRMRRLIESLLQLARLDAGQAAPQRAAFDLASRVAEAIAGLRPLAGRRGIALHSELTPTKCMADAEQIDGVIINLITNAIHHGREAGEVRIVVRREHGRATLTVSDDGPGIAPEHLPHVFKRFYRVDHARSSGAGNMGLGLAIAKAIVDAHNGTIEVENRPDGGARSTVTLPET
jgi:signal transduction histidine kinase